MVDPSKVNFKKQNGLVPCVVQDASTRVVLMLGFMNEEALQKTMTEHKVTFFSRTKQRLWTKGETSGNLLRLVDIIPDCDHDTLLVKAIPKGAACHTGDDTCFGEENQSDGLLFLENIIQDRKKNPQPGSYTNRLFEGGINKVAQKVGEEAFELVIESKDNNADLFLNEAADLLYHYLVLLVAKGHSLNDVVRLLQERHAKPA